MLIEFYELNYKLLIFLIFPLFSTIEDYAKKLYLTKNNFMYKMFLYFLSYNFSFVFLLIFLRKNKKKSIIYQKIDLNQNGDNNYLENIQSQKSIDLGLIKDLDQKIGRKKKIRSFLFILILCIINKFVLFSL